LMYSSDCDFVADNLVQIEEHDETTRSHLISGLTSHRLLNLEEFALGNVSRRGLLRKELGFLKPMMRRSFLKEHGLHYDETLRLGEDYALYARALALGARFVIVPSPGYVSVLRSSSISGKHTRADLERFRDVDIVLGGMAGLSPREKRALQRHYESVD